MPTRGNSSRLPASQGLAYDVTHLDRAIFFPSPPPHTYSTYVSFTEEYVSDIGRTRFD